MNKKKLLKTVLLLVIACVIVAGVLFLIISNNSISKLRNNTRAQKEFTGTDSLKTLSLGYLLENAADKYTACIKGIKKPDLLFVKKDYLTNNIDRAIYHSKKRLANKEFTADQFLHYVLPYRIGYERLENWRQIAVDSCMDCYNDTLIIHAGNINNKIRKGFQYGGKSRENRTLSDMLNHKNGYCYEMSDMAAFVMRANGLPVAVDFAKWSGTPGNHQWNSLITKTRNYPFMGLESNPSEETTEKEFRGEFKNAAKYYRKTFLKYDKKYKRFNPKKIINRINYIDVTAEYCPDCKDLIVNFKEYNYREEVFFLCVYDNNRWIPVDFAYSEKGVLRFKDVCPNNVFTLKQKKGKKLKYFKSPFTFDKSGNVSFVNTDKSLKTNLKLRYDNSYYRELGKNEKELGITRTSAVLDSMKRFNFTAVVNDTIDYRLYYWKNKWLSVADAKAKNGTIVFNDAPANALYKLVDLDEPGTKTHRCFTVDENNKQFFWSGN